MDVLVTQSIGKSHPLNYISAQEKNCKQIGNERWWVAKTSRSRASNEARGPLIVLASRKVWF